MIIYYYHDSLQLIYLVLRINTLCLFKYKKILTCIFALMNGVVIKSTGSWYQVKINNADLVECRLKGKFRTKKIKSTNPIVVGDKVVIDKIDQS